MKRAAINIGSTGLISVDKGVLIASRTVSRAIVPSLITSIGNPSVEAFFELQKFEARTKSRSCFFLPDYFVASIQNSIDHQQPARAGNVHVSNSTRMN